MTPAVCAGVRQVRYCLVFLSEYLTLVLYKLSPPDYVLY